jgi:integrase
MRPIVRPSAFCECPQPVLLRGQASAVDTHATILLRAGVHPKVVSERLGHSTVGITLDVYSHVLPDMQEQAAQAIDEAFGTG